MKCEQIKNLLSPYVDDMVDNKDKALIDAHIAACPKCRQQVEDYRHIANMMRGLESPSVPDNFSDELNRRIRDEQNKILDSYPLKTPKKSGWAAAVLAVFALTGGIYASTHWSLGNVVTAWHDSNEENQKKPLISIDSIIERFQKWQGSDDSKDDLIQNDNDRNGTDNKPVTQVAKTKEPASSSSLNENITEDGNNLTSAVKVENIEESLPQVLKIAANYGAAYRVIPPEENLPEDARQISRKILLEVTESEAEQIIKEIEALGQPLALVNDEAASFVQAGDGANSIDSANQDQAVKEESSKEESLMEASAKEEPIEEESPKEEPLKEEPQKDETPNEENSKEESLKEESPETGVLQEESAKERSLKEESVTQLLVEQVESSEPELLTNPDNPSSQPGVENNTMDIEIDKEKKITLSIYLIEDKEQIKP